MRDPADKNTSLPECVNLPAEEWLAVDHIIFALHDCGTVGNLEDFVLNELPGKLGADFASWNEHNPEMFLERVENSESHREKIAPLVPVLNESLPTHPLFPDYFDFGTGKVIYSDTVDRTRAAVSEEEYRNTDFFLNVADKLGIEDQLRDACLCEKRARNPAHVSRQPGILPAGTIEGVHRPRTRHRQTAHALP